MLGGADGTSFYFSTEWVGDAEDARLLSFESPHHVRGQIVLALM